MIRLYGGFLLDFYFGNVYRVRILAYRLLEFSDSSVMLQRLKAHLGLSVLVLCATEIRAGASAIAGISRQSLCP